MSDERFELMRAKLDELADLHRRELNRLLFDVPAPLARQPATGRWRLRLQRVNWRVRAYLSTLWDALRGRDPYEPSDW